MKLSKFFTVLTLSLFASVSNAQNSLADKLKAFKEDANKLNQKIANDSKNSQAPSALPPENNAVKKGVFKLGDENSILVWSYDIDPSSAFKYTPKNLDKQTWINNVGVYYDAPMTVTDDELDKFEATYYNKLYSILNGPKLNASYKKCISGHMAALENGLATMKQEIGAATTQAQRNKLQNNYNTIKQNSLPISQSWCGFKFLKRTMYTLNVPNYSAEQNRSTSDTYAYENMWIGQIYRAVNSLVRGDMTDEFYSGVQNELNLSPDEWRDATVVALTSPNGTLNKYRAAQLSPYLERIFAGYQKHIGIMHTLIAEKKLVKP